MPRGNIIVVGSCNMDMYIVAERLPSPGETVLGGAFETHPGGKGANQAVAAARAGSAVSLVGCVGADMFGNELIANLKEEGVSVDLVERDRKHPTGVAMIMVDSSAENLIAVAPGANTLVTTELIERAGPRLRTADYVLLQMEIPAETVSLTIETAWRESTPVALNAAPVRGEPIDAELLSKVDVLIVNASEAEALSGVEVVDDTSAENACLALKEMGAARVVVTLGAEGALALADECVYVPARSVEAIDTVGAGDAFSGALVTALSEGMEFVESVHFATAAAALATTKVGAQASLPARTDIESLWRS